MTTSGSDREPAAEPDNRPVRLSGECAMSPDPRAPGLHEPGKEATVKTEGAALMSHERRLKEVEAQFGLIRDRLRGVCDGYSNGLYLFGPPGISKTHTVVNYLNDNSIPFEHVQGHLTGSALFDVLEETPAGVIVLDDVAGLFKEPKGVQLLLAALGSPPDGSRVRKVPYRTARGTRVVDFTGGIVAITNLALEDHRSGIIAALADRVHVQKFDPTPQQVEALIFKIAMKGVAGVAAADAVMVARFLVEECRTRGTRLTVRLLVNNALPDFRMWKAGKAENHWTILVRATVAKEFVPQRHAVRGMSHNDQMEADRRIVLAICKEFRDPMERVRAWKAWNETARQGSATKP
jgi:hypothetical protein